MIQPLNYTAKARESLAGITSTASPFSRHGIAYLLGKLTDAEIFVLPDHGELLDRSKPRTEVPNIVLRPPFPVTALEYRSPPGTAHEVPGYTDAACSRRVALAWDWKDDLPHPIAAASSFPPRLPAGVAIAAICYFDQMQAWLPIAAGMHIAYDDPWLESDVRLPFAAAAVAAGRMTEKQADARRPRARPFPILWDAILGIASARGIDGALDLLAADMMDEANAYIDLCYALACRNVSAERHVAPAKLNRAREKAGKIALPDFHTLTLAGSSDGQPFGSADRSGPRSHLRRGHIRRLGPDRITWVNQTMVRGRGGFVSKQYDLRRAGGARG
ncbi:hypothetical protein HRJ34_00050 [Rhizorhabdus wittichii]|uniref:Uncharacterized protein n=1 Tax=Rhizorhabdus wittichii TaxID=160791 RepID=A0A975D5C8_9SPHN|nr:hypothetical protein [Rhizorhabdus wittichii]QTH21970.1 hypothetical protein HRJ34_00050 [Rhizorhabdus wittichii]